jgi:AraC-like DNA-binding protein
MIQSLFISMPMMVCAIFAMELMLKWLQSHDSAQGWLALWALVTTLLYSGHFVFFHHAHDLLPLSDTVYVACNLMVYPLYLIYISELTDERPISSRLFLLVVLLGFPVVASLTIWTLYAGMSPVAVDRFFNLYLYEGSHDGLAGTALVQAWVHDAARVVFGLQVLGVMVAGIRKIRRYNHRLKYHFADTDDKHLGSITVMLWLFVVISLFSVLVNAIGRQWFEGSMLLALPSLLFSVLLFCIGWTGLFTRSYIYEMSQAEPACSSAVTAPANSGPDYQSLASQFEQLMTVEQLYLQHDLRLDMVVQRLGTNRTYLLAALKQVMGMSFNEYVNHKRIAYARKLIENNPDMLKSDVAIRSGYNSQSAFYRNWKAVGG